MYNVTHGKFKTPRGQLVEMAYREDTNDFNVLSSCLTEDEYGLRSLELTGTALDIGAHIGGVCVGLAVDNPDLQVVAVEAVPPNIELLTENITRVGVADRVTVLHAAAGKGKTAVVSWGFSGNEPADHHTFIGNAVMPEADLRAGHATKVDVRTLASLVKEFGTFCFAKVDCEGCEYDFLQDIAVSDIELIRGEEHSRPLNIPGYAITYEQANAPRGFEAVPE